MANLTKTEMIEQIDFERRESNAKFISPIQTGKLLNRAVKRVIREPGIRTLPSLQNITAVANTTRYALDSDFKEVITLWTGEGSASGIQFTYLPPDDFNAVVRGYHYTFLEPGYIEIKFPDVNSLPSSTLKLRFWSKNIILDADGVTRKRMWVNEEDTSGLEEEFDDFYVEWCTALILRREGKAEWKDRMSSALDILASIKEQSGSKSRRTSKAFGHYKFGVNGG